jgi:hypothetical protein
VGDSLAPESVCSGCDDGKRESEEMIHLESIEIMFEYV